MGTPRARKNVGMAPVKSVTVRPQRPDSVLHPVADKGIRMPVRPDTRRPVRPISVRHGITVGEKTL